MNYSNTIRKSVNLDFSVSFLELDLNEFSFATGRMSSKKKSSSMKPKLNSSDNLTSQQMEASTPRERNDIINEQIKVIFPH